METLSPFSIAKESVFFILKKPKYLAFGVISTIGIWFPLKVSPETKGFFDPESSKIFAEKLTILFGSPEMALFALFLFPLFLWGIKIVASNFTSLNVFYAERKLIPPIIKNFLRALKNFHSIFLLFILACLSLTFLFSFLAIPVLSLVGGGSFIGSWLVGLFALCIGTFSIVVVCCMVFYARFYILFGKLTLKSSLDSAYTLYQKKKKQTFTFLGTFLVFFLILLSCTLVLPGFLLSREGIIPSAPNLSFMTNLVGFLFSLSLLIFFFTLFNIASVVFFLRVAKQPKEAVIEENKTSPANLEHLLKKKSERFQEAKRE